MAIIEVKDLNDFELSNMEQGYLLELLVDTNNKKILHVDPNKGHMAVAMEYLGLGKDQINEITARHLVSVLIEIPEKHVRKIYIGRSSLELAEKIHHSRTEITRARRIIERMLRLSGQLHEIETVDNIRDKEVVFS